MKTSTASHIGRFVWHDLITDDSRRAQDFYTQLLGWKFVQTQGPNGNDYTLIKNHGRYIAGLLQLDDPADGGDYSRWLGYLSVSDLDLALDKAASNQSSIVVPAQTIPSIGRAAAIIDPQGAVLGLISSNLEKPGFGDPVMSGDIVWDELLTGDPQQAADFYQQLSGVDVETIVRRQGQYRYLFASGKESAGILENPFADTDPVWLTYIAVEDPAASAQQAAKLGAKILIEPADDIREGTLALITDPTGALLVLVQTGTGDYSGAIQ